MFLSMVILRITYTRIYLNAKGYFGLDGDEFRCADRSHEICHFSNYGLSRHYKNAVHNQFFLRQITECWVQRVANRTDVVESGFRIFNSQADFFLMWVEVSPAVAPNDARDQYLCVVAQFCHLAKVIWAQLAVGFA